MHCKMPLKKASRISCINYNTAKPIIDVNFNESDKSLNCPTFKVPIKQVG